MNRNRRLVGAAVATAAAMLFVTGGGAATAADNAGTVKVKCYGANACKGQAECKTSMNECKGHGFLEMTQAECDAAKAKISKEKEG